MKPFYLAVLADIVFLLVAWHGNFFFPALDTSAVLFGAGLAIASVRAERRKKRL